MTITSLGYLLLGLFQLFAITLGLSEWLHLHWAITLVIAVFIAPMPIVGTVVAVLAAVKVWHWPLLKACAMFGIPLLLLITLNILMGDARQTVNKMRRKKPPSQ